MRPELEVYGRSADGSIISEIILKIRLSQNSQDLIQLCLTSTFMPELTNQAKIHEKSLSSDPAEREEAAKQLGWKHNMLTDKTQAWSDVLRLINDEVEEVVGWASNAIGLIFVEVPDKNRAWTDLHELGCHKNLEVRRGVAKAFAKGFAHVPDQFKHEAWCDLHQLIYDEASEVRCWAVNSLLQAYPHILAADRVNAWSDLHRCTYDADIEVREEATSVLGYGFIHISNVSEGWSDLHRLSGDANGHIRRASAVAIGKAFAHLPDRNNAFLDLHRLAQDQDPEVRAWGVWSVGLAYPHIILEDHRVEAWSDIHRLTKDSNGYVRESAATAITLIIDHIPDQTEAISDLHRLSIDEHNKVRKRVAIAYQSSFKYTSDKNQLCINLHRLTNDRNADVRRSAVASLGNIFAILPESYKQEALVDLHHLIDDNDKYVRMYAYFSLGKASVLEATEMDNYDEIKRDLEIAISYFEKSTQQDVFGGPAKFCHLFYRTYFKITFQEADEDEVKRYISEAKEAVGRSKSKDELLMAIESLAKALQESRLMKHRSVYEISRELNDYRLYCEKAAEHMASAEVGAPGAVKLMRKCNPLLEERIQAIISEIKEKARQICRITRGSDTRFEDLGLKTHQAATGLSTGDLVSIQRSGSSIVKQLKKFCILLPEKEKEQVCRDVEQIEQEADIPEKLHLIDRALYNLEPILESHRRPLVDVVILTVLPEEYSRVLAKLSGLGLPQHMDSAPNICAWRFGEAFCPNHNSAYKVAVGMIGRAGDIQSALAAKDAISRWRPNYLVFSGIAGGLSDAALKKGDVIIADCIYGYEYGKIEENFKPRGNWTFKTDQGLLTGANAYALQESWRDHIKAEPPEECEPKVISGEIASGEKVIDDPTNEFFKQVIKALTQNKMINL
jgi:HEAT repeat protein/nucleoside phosphorylase